MAALVCLECTATYSVGAARCPQCGGTESRGDWDEPADDAPVDAPAAVSMAAVRGESGPELSVPAGQKIAPADTPPSGGDRA